MKLLLVCLLLSTVLVSSLKIDKFAKILVTPLAAISLISTPVRAELIPSPWDANIKYEILKSNPDAAIPTIGENVAIRFKGSYKGLVFDDTFPTEQPYFTRAGGGSLMKGIDETVLHMHVGDKYHLVFSGEYSFPNGRPASAGRPRIPPGGEVDFDLELSDIPGVADEFIADVE